MTNNEWLSMISKHFELKGNKMTGEYQERDAT